jgi:hypothetical protein
VSRTVLDWTLSIPDVRQGGSAQNNRNGLSDAPLIP